MSVHSWCRDIPRDEAVRAAEDGRQGPLPTLEEAISRAGQFMPPEAPQRQKCTERESGLRTERVVLEVKHELDEPLGDWIVQVIDESLGYDESVRVVEEAHFDDLANVAMERDAIRERDELRTECERLRGTVAALEGQSRMDLEREIAVEEAWELCDIRPHWPDDEPGTSHRYAKSMRLEIVRLRASVAELESAATLAPAANADGGPNHAPAASGAAGPEANG